MRSPPERKSEEPPRGWRGVTIFLISLLLGTITLTVVIVALALAIR